MQAASLQNTGLAAGAPHVLPALHYVTGVSLPRSGHHLLAGLLRSYFGPRLVYCPHYTKSQGMEKNKANCCDVELCTHKHKVTYCKNHDFHGLIPKVAGARYLVQYRDFLPSMISSYELYVKNGNEDSEKRFRKFSDKKVGQYNNFVKKWILSEDNHIQKLVIKYEDLTSAPEEWLEKALQFFGTENVVRSRIRDLVATAPKTTYLAAQQLHDPSAGVKNSRKVEEFRHYSQPWFDELAKRTVIKSRA